MNRLTFWTILALACLTASRAGAQNSRWDVSLSAGGAFPAGTFVNFNAFYAKGYAKTGWDADAMATYRVWKNWGVTVLAGYQDNPYDSRNNGALDLPSFTAVRLMAGPSYRIPLRLDKGWSLTARLLVGAQRSDLDFSHHESTPFTWEPGLELQRDLGKNLYLKLGGDYTFSQGNSDVRFSPEVPVYSINRRLIDANLGIGIRF
ncbi:MAG TPA: hypothetical protein VL547_16165 [Dinghuibacter sp.]|jgi:hypothetical protein|uniref:hypothetical protein n=1 Tax=Dinghuibacter sp. TaxID=2024697 RepID=UPI002B6936EA|nr:hypothetical protein [Dinghuibacter sp.]HTJ13572.1 hypothetical protein [Dinghuibacter sp.]